MVSSCKWNVNKEKERGDENVLGGGDGRVAGGGRSS